MDWTRAWIGVVHGRRHAIGPDAEVTDDGAPALCGRWLSVVEDPADGVGSEGRAGHFRAASTATAKHRVHASFLAAGHTSERVRATLSSRRARR